MALLNGNGNGKDKEKHDDSANYSKDADQTRFLWMAFAICMTVILGLFTLEFFHIEEEAMLFTPEIVHIMVNGLALSFFGLGTYIWGKSVGANEALAKMAGNGGNGNGNGSSTNTNQNKSNNNTKQNGSTQK